MSYVSNEAKAEQKKRMMEQVGSVHDKMKRWADKVQIGGYVPKVVERNEGDVWEDADGKQWTVKNGIKQTVDKLQSAKAPWWCPKCGRAMNHKLHDKFYRLRGTCHDCVVVYEGKMRVDGVWDAYERRVLRNNEKSWLTDKIIEINEAVSNFRAPQLHFQDGRWEELAPKAQFNDELERQRQDALFLGLRLAQVEKEEREDAEEQNKLLEWEKLHPWTTENTNEKS